MIVMMWDASVVSALPVGGLASSAGYQGLLEIIIIITHPGL